MNDFPKICELPTVLKTDGWEWQQYSTPSNPSYDFWVGTDSNGVRWLTKLKGAFSGYREIVFARLAQEMGWSCQSSVFAIFDDNSQEQLSIKEKSNNIHAVHFFMEEHNFDNCSPDCPLLPLRGAGLSIDKLKKTGIHNVLDWPKSDLAACIFGAGEPSDYFFTSSHDFVIIDSEQMFSSSPGDINQTSWEQKSVDPGLEYLKLETLKDINALTTSTIELSLEIPPEINFEKKWSIRSKIESSRNFVKNLSEGQRVRP